MREEKTSTLEYGVYVLALLMAAFIAWQLYGRFGGARTPAAARTEGPASAPQLGGETESAVSVVPAVKLTAIGGRRRKTSLVPPPSK